MRYLFAAEGSEVTQLSKAPGCVSFSEENTKPEHSLEGGGQVPAESSLGIFSFNLFQKVSL